MSFKDDYKNQIESLSADGYLKEKILKKIEEKEKKSFNFFSFKSLAVATLCLILAVAIALPGTRNFFTNKFRSASEIKTPYVSSENATAETEEQEADTKKYNYEEIYDKLSIFQSDSEGFDYITKDDGIVMYAEESNKSFDSAQNKSNSANSAKPGASNDKNDASADSEDFSETNNQVEGVDEADVVKTDGKYIYALTVRDRKIRIIKAGKKPEEIGEIYLENPYYGQDMYIHKDRLVIFGTKVPDIARYDKRMIDYNRSGTTEAYIYDISKPEKPEKVIKCVQSGDYSDSRLIGNKLYMISNYFVNTNDMNKDDIETYVPSVECKDYNKPMEAKCIHVSEYCNTAVYTVICGYDITDGSLKGSQSVLGGTYALYCSTENIIAAGYEHNNYTSLKRFAIKDGNITFKGEGKVRGSLLNQFSIDEYKGNFRFVTTYTYGEDTTKPTASGSSGTVIYRMITANMLTVLDSNLKQIGSIEKIAPEERVYSVRFMGDIAYFVTFRQVDPLFSVDLSDPKNPKIIGALKIPGFSDYLFPFGENLLLGIGQDADEETGRTKGMKLSMFDTKNPSDVKESAKAILDVFSSDALFSHKSSLISYDRNLIGFDVYNDGRGYMLYSFENGKFIKRAQYDLGDTSLYVRGLYIGDLFYIVTGTKVLSIDINTFKVLNEVDFK